MAIATRLLQLLMIAAVAGASAWMTWRWGPWRAMAILAAGMAASCAAVAAVVRVQPIGKVSAANYVMGLVLPWGYRIGQGRLVPIVATSWFVWMLIGLAAAVGVATSAPSEVQTETQRSLLMMTLLVLAWIVDGALLLFCVSVFATHTQRDHVVHSLGLLALLLAGMIAGSIAMVTLGQSASSARWALVLAGGPPALGAAGYGVFVLTVLLSGRRTRWN